LGSNENFKLCFWDLLTRISAGIRKYEIIKIRTTLCNAMFTYVTCVQNM
jgi:hypothetical protein